MILQTFFFCSRLGLIMLVVGCWSWVVGIIVQSNQWPIANNPKPTTQNLQPITNNHEIKVTQPKTNNQKPTTMNNNPSPTVFPSNVTLSLVFYELIYQYLTVLHRKVHKDIASCTYHTHKCHPPSFICEQFQRDNITFRLHSGHK